MTETATEIGLVYMNVGDWKAVGGNRNEKFTIAE